MGAKQSSATKSLMPMISTAGARQQDLLDLMQRTPPQKNRTDILGLSDMMRKLELLKEYQSRASERELSPELAQARLDAEKVAAGDFEAAARGELPPSQQAAMMKESLMSQMATGAPVGGGLDFGGASAASIYGRKANEYLQGAKNFFQQYLANKAAPQGGIDPTSAANIKLTEAAKNQDLENAFRQQLLQATMGAEGNMQNMAMGLGEMGAREDIANRDSGGGWGSLLGLAGTVAGGAFGGPGGALIGGTAGSGLGGLLGGSKGATAGTGAMGGVLPGMASLFRTQKGVSSPDIWSWR